jgi:hypothetical protein
MQRTKSIYMLGYQITKTEKMKLLLNVCERNEYSKRNVSDYQILNID